MTMKLGTTIVNNKDTKKKRNFKGASTKKGFGPVNAPAMGANGSKEQGVIATGGYGADAGGAGGNGGATGGVMASVEGGKMFREFMESITTPHNTDTVSAIMEAYELLYGNSLNEGIGSKLAMLAISALATFAHASPPKNDYTAQDGKQAAMVLVGALKQNDQNAVKQQVNQDKGKLGDKEFKAGFVETLKGYGLNIDAFTTPSNNTKVANAPNADTDNVIKTLTTNSDIVSNDEQVANNMGMFALKNAQITPQILKEKNLTPITQQDQNGDYVFKLVPSSNVASK